MKTICKIIIIVLSLSFQSCNMAKHYGNMRIKNSTDEPQVNEPKEEVVFENEKNLSQKKPVVDIQIHEIINKQSFAQEKTSMNTVKQISAKSTHKTKINVHLLVKKLIPNFKLNTKVKKKKTRPYQHGRIIRSNYKSSIELNENVETILWILAVIVGLFIISAFYALDEGITFWVAFGIVGLEFLIGLAAITLLTFGLLKLFGFYD